MVIEMLVVVLGVLIGIGLQIVFTLGCAVSWQTLQTCWSAVRHSIDFAVTVTALARVFAQLLKIKL